MLSQLRARTGHNFAHYKRSTVLRRIDRRIHVRGADLLADDFGHLREDAALLDVLLINVVKHAGTGRPPPGSPRRRERGGGG